MIRILLMFSLSLLVVGCKSEDPNPELKDPIFKDLKARADGHAKGIDEGKKKLEELSKALAKTEANSIELKDVKRDIAKTRAKLSEDEKWAKYFKIRADRRAVMDKVSAREAASVDKPWPDPHEYSEYQLNNRLREVSLNWNKRVPKLQDRLSKPPVKEVEAASEAQANAGGGH